MSKAFSAYTLERFEEAAASVPLRQLDRAFDAATIRAGADPGGPVGSRRSRFRCYVATVDQRDLRQRDRLGDALGALIAEVAASKEAFLIGAAERDGFSFANGVFRESETSTSSFAVTHGDGVSSIEERAKRLHLLAAERPAAAMAGAKELVASACRSSLEAAGAPIPQEHATLGELVEATLRAYEPKASRAASLRNVAGVVEAFDGLPERSPRHARLIADLAAALATYVATASR